MTTETTGQLLHVLRPADGADYSLGGISTRSGRLVLIGWTGHDVATGRTEHSLVPLDRAHRAPFRPSEEHPACALEIRCIGRPVASLIPVEYDAGRGRWTPNRGVMSGGNYAVGDSRLSELLTERLGVGFYGAVAIHDRIEH